MDQEENICSGEEDRTWERIKKIKTLVSKGNRQTIDIFNSCCYKKRAHLGYNVNYAVQNRAAVKRQFCLCYMNY